MAQGDPQGWEVLSSNDPIKYQAVLRLDRSQGAGQVKQNIRVITNRSNGNYDVYTTAFGVGDQLIYSYNASDNKTTVSNQAIYDQIFTGQRSNQLNNLNSDVRKATLQLAENNVTGGSNSISSRDLQQLKNSQGYKSLANAAPAPAPTSDPPLTPGPGADPDSDPAVTAFTGIDFNPTTYENTEKAETKLNGGILVYPRDHGDSGFDFISIQPIEYIAQLDSNTLRSPTESGFTSLKTASQRLRKEVKTGPAIYLPMTPGISETNSVGWGEDRLNAVQLALGNKAMDIISNPDSLTNIDTALGNLSGIVNTLTHLADSPGLKNYISAYFAGQAVSANLLGRSGMVINPNLELLFQGPKLRSFRYNFRFTPRDADEAEIIRAIIKTLKKTMAVRRNSTSIFLGVPSVYKIKYIYNGGGDHPFLNKIKPCALTAFNVNYTPDGSYMTYGSNDPNNPNAKGAGSMTSYTVDMQFDEIEPIYNEDIDDVDGPTTGY